MTPRLACELLLPRLLKILLMAVETDGVPSALHGIYARNGNILLQGHGREEVICGDDLAYLVEDDDYLKVTQRALAAYQRLRIAVYG